MDEDKFKLDRSNIIFIIITGILVIALVVVAIMLSISLSKPIDDLPELEVTRKKTSTVSRVTTSKTISTTTTTTKRIMESPYYETDVDALFDQELLLKSNLNRNEATKLLEQFYMFTNKLYNTNDNSLFDIKTVIDYAKKNEFDKIVVNNHNYGELYDLDTIIKKYMHILVRNNLPYVEYNGTKIFIKEKNKYYRLEALDKTGSLIFDRVMVDSYNSKKITGSVTYYMSNYKEEGFTAPVYKTVNLVLEFDETNWKLREYKYPLYK